MKFAVAVLALVVFQPAPTASDAQALISGTSAIVVMTINNPSMYDVYIVSGTSESAESVTLRDGGKTIESITVPAYGSVTLAPSEMLVALSGLKGQFKDGDELKLTLETDGGVAIAIAAIVKAEAP
jgi:copper(I)-binding protein